MEILNPLLLLFRFFRIWRQMTGQCYAKVSVYIYTCDIAEIISY